MLIAVDAMGGDRAPAEIVAGAVLARRGRGLESILVGPEDVIQAELAKHNASGLLPIHHAPQIVGMGESPSRAVRAKKDSSICQAVELVRSGRADGLVSAGNSGATVVAAILALGRVRGIERPGLATVFPSIQGPFMVIDVGASPDARPGHLYQFGLMGNLYAEKILGYDRPRIGLMSVGEEDGKGNDKTKKAHELFRQAPINFVGNVEGRDLFNGEAEVVVCDGFVGNVILKLSEGVVDAFTAVLKREMKASPVAAFFTGPFLRAGFKRFKKKYSYDAYGGAPLLGVNGACLVCHGKSNARAIKNAIASCVRWIDQDFNAELQRTLEETVPGKDDNRIQ